MSIITELKRWRDSRPNENTFPTSHLETWPERQRRKAALFIIYLKTLVYFSVVAMVMPPTWPYLQSLDPNASKTLVGWIIVGVPALRPINALLVGWVLKHLSIRLVTIVSGIFILLACAMWSTAYHAPIYGGYWLLFSRFVIGFFGAEFQIGTTHVASATTKEERSTAMTILAGCLSIAYMMAPGLMSVISYVGPVGVTVGGYILNMYTVAGLIGLTVYAAALLLFVVYYEENDIAVREDKLSEAKTPPAGDEQEELFPSPPPASTDYLAVAVCNVIGAHCYGWLQLPDTMMTPMAMDLYGWSEEHAVRRAGNILTIYGLLALACFAISGRLAKRFPERGIMLLGNALYLAGALVMFPVAGPTPPLAEPAPGGANLTLPEVNVTSLHLLRAYRSPGGHAYAMNVIGGGWALPLAAPRLQLRGLDPGSGRPLGDVDPVTGRRLGCPPSQTWCLTEPRPHLAQLVLSFGLVMMATPFVLPMVNSVISKLLPAGNQSVMWGIVNGSANVGRLAYPLLNVYVYTFLGPRTQYGVMIALCLLTVLLQLAMYRRLKPRPAAEDRLPLTEAKTAGYGATKVENEED